MNNALHSITSDSPWYINEWELLLRLFIAVLLGGLVGFEREQSNHAAGFRTNILVCLGSCLLMLLSIYGFAQFVNETNVRLDPARLAAQVITGIGFLGAGTILFTGKSITGLTTAASLWVVSAIGLSVGAGFLLPAVATTVLVLLVLVVLNKLEKIQRRQARASSEGAGRRKGSAAAGRERLARGAGHRHAQAVAAGVRRPGAGAAAGHAPAAYYVSEAG